MKRAIALALAMLLLGGAVAAADWREGTSPAMPYDGVPEMDLSKQIGYMMFYPQADIPAQNMCQKLCIYLPREDATAGEGVVSLRSEEGKELYSTAMNDEEAVTRRDITEQELDGLMWGGGTCFEIALPKTLELGKTYYVTLDRGCIAAPNGVENPQMNSTDGWRFTLEGEYGVSAMAYRRALAGGRYDERVFSAQAGDEIRFDLVLGGDAVKAVLYGYGDSVDFLTTTYETSCEVTGEVAAPNPSWGVVFLDSEGNELKRIDFTR